MKKNKWIAGTIAALMMPLNGCHDTVDSDRIPYAMVYVDLSTQGIWDTYGVHGFGQYNEFIHTGSSAVQRPSNFHYNDMSATGFGGLLLVANLENMPLLYDLACPVERKQSVRVVYDRDTQIATCPECGSQYNVCEHFGSPISGQAFQRKWGLQRYTARPAAMGGYILSR